MRAEVSLVIDRPLADVFDIFARDHVHNHPRWDPKMELEQVSEGPIGVGTVLPRRHSHFEIPVEGTMEVVEYEPDRAFGLVIHEGPTEMHARTTFEAARPDRTSVTFLLDMAGADESMDPTLFSSLMEGWARNIKDFIESEP